MATNSRELVEQVLALAGDALGAARTQALVDRGRALDEATAAALAAGDDSVVRGDG